MSRKKQTPITVNQPLTAEETKPTYREKKNNTPPQKMTDYFIGDDTNKEAVEKDAVKKDDVLVEEKEPARKKKSSTPKPKKQKTEVKEEEVPVTEDTTTTAEENVNEMVDKLVEDIIDGGAPAPIKTELDDDILNKVAKVMNDGCMNPSFILKYAGLFFTNPEVFNGKMKSIRKDLTSLIIDDVREVLHANGYEPDLAKPAIKMLWLEFTKEFHASIASSIKKEVREEIIAEKMKDYVKNNFTETDVYKNLVGVTSSDTKLFNMLNNHVKESVTPPTIDVEEAAERTALLLPVNSVIDAISYEKPASNLYNKLLDIASIKSPTNEEIEKMYKDFMVFYLSEIMPMKPEYVTVEIDKWISIRKSNKDWFNLVSFWVLSAFDMSTDTDSFIGCMATLYPKTHDVVMCSGGVQEYLHTLAKEINFALGSGEYYTR